MTTGCLLAPGASADRNQSALVALDDALSALGISVRRMDFPYKREGRRAPDREPVLLDAIRAEAKQLGVTKLIAGGRSMGGRMCSLAAADGLKTAGLVLVSYPLHPPGRPEKLRTAHFPQLTMPCLFVSGTRDTFGTPKELEAATSAIPGAVTHVWLEGKDHGLRGCDRAVADAVVGWFSAAGLLPRRRRTTP